jgi:alkylation response protein AidB-like acyl-CoA dehydrogenase
MVIDQTLAVTSAVRTEAELLATIDGFAEEFARTAPVHDREGSFPTDSFDVLRQGGLLALTASPADGGEGLWNGDRFTTYYKLLEHLARFDANTSQLLQVHSHALGMLCTSATEAQMEKHVRPIIAAGQVLASVGSESKPSSTGDGLYAQELQPHPDGGWVLTCEKHFASVAAGADHLIIWLAVPGDEPYELRTVSVLVPVAAPEVTLVDDWDVMGMRATVSWTVTIDGLHLADDAVFGLPGHWVTTDKRTFTLGFAANHVGHAEGILDFCTAWLRKRPHLQSSDLMMYRIGDLSSKIQAAQALVYSAGALWDAGNDTDAAEFAGVQALHVAKQALLETAQQAFDICGARAIFRSLPLEQAYRDARVFTLHTRDEHLTASLGRGLVTGQYSGKGYIDGATVTRTES